MADAKQLKEMANKLRIESIMATTAAGSGHPTSCMSCAEIMSALFFSQIKRGDEFILSKGHAAPILWAALAEAGFIPRKELMNLRKITSSLEGHPTPNMPLVKVATGSLGQGLSAGVGMAAAKKLKNAKEMVYVLMGDGECAEGSVWEAANTAAFMKLGNLCAIIDMNRLGQSQETMHGRNADAYKKKFEAFGWDAETADGHDIIQILKALGRAGKQGKPFALIAKTVKGKGVSFLEDKQGWHGKALGNEEMEKALSEIGSRGPAEITLKSCYTYRRENTAVKPAKPSSYNIGEMESTRNAYGKALLNLGRLNSRIAAIDGDVRNSTMMQKFFEMFPERSFESFIAEQNMAGMAIGLSAEGFVPFAATFAAFWTRAHDFIRMAAYSKANIKFAGSHAGVSIGEDGPSQMGLEDIPMFTSIPGAVVVYPCDAVSAENLVNSVAVHKGISYMRTTREKTPVVYGKNEKFRIGGLKVLKKSSKDSALVVGAGITVHEALKAYEILKKEGIIIRVIDLYSVKPVDEKSLLKNAAECKNRVISVEDHYFGGIGAAVSSVVGKTSQLYVKSIPRSGKPEELRKMCCIDSDAIVKEVKKLLNK